MRIDKGKIQIIMAERGLKQQDVAGLAKMSRQNFNIIINGKECRPTTISKVAAGLKCRVRDIIETETKN